MSLLLPCPACGENRKADEGHSICRQCEGYAPADGPVSGEATAEVEAIAASVYPAVFSGRSDVGPATRARRRGVLRDVEKMIQALDSLRASRQPASGGPEGDLKEAVSNARDFFAAIPQVLGAEQMREEMEAALSRVPAVDCTCGNGEAEEDRMAVLRCPVHCPVPTDGVWPDESGVESGSLAEYRAIAPADGPVSASRPPEAGLGDRQLTAEAFSHKEIQTLMAAMAGNHPASLAEYRLPVLRKLARAAGPGAQGPWSEKDVRRLASGENPDDG